MYSLNFKEVLHAFSTWLKKKCMEMFMFESQGSLTTI